MGSTASTAGVSLDELLGIVAATKQVTARGGAVIGNAFKTIFTRIQRPKVLDALAALQVKIKDNEGNALSMMAVLENLAGTYDKLNSRQQSMVAEMVGGVFQVNVLKAALGDLGKEYSLYSNAVDISNKATNEAERRNKMLNQTISSQLVVTLNNLVKAGSAVGKLTFGPAIGDSLKGINKLLEGFDGESTGSKIGQTIAKGLLSGIGAAIKGPGIALLTLGIFKMFERLSKFGADALGSVLGFNSKAKETQIIQQQIVATMSKNPQILASITSGLKTEAQLHREILGTISAENAQMIRMNRLAGSIAAKLAKSGVSFGTEGILKDTLVAPGRSKAAGYVPNLSQKRYETQKARSLGAPASVRAKWHPNVKAGGRRGIMANDKEEIISPKQFKKRYGVTPKGGESAIIPKYGAV